MDKDFKKFTFNDVEELLKLEGAVGDIVEVIGGYINQNQYYIKKDTLNNIVMINDEKKVIARRMKNIIKHILSKNKELGKCLPKDEQTYTEENINLKNVLQEENEILMSELNRIYTCRRNKLKYMEDNKKLIIVCNKTIEIIDEKNLLSDIKKGLRKPRHMKEYKVRPACYLKKYKNYEVLGIDIKMSVDGFLEQSMY